MQDDDASTTIPLVEEKVVVKLRETETGRVRISTRTEAFVDVVRQQLQGTRAEVVRTQINRTLEPGETPPQPRTEGEVMIIPIFEEVVIVEKRLVLTEELRITPITTTEIVEVPIELRKQRADVEYVPSADEPN